MRISGVGSECMGYYVIFFILVYVLNVINSLKVIVFIYWVDRVILSIGVIFGVIVGNENVDWD